MLDFTRMPALTPELLLGSDPLPAASGPVRFTLADRPEQPTVIRECFKKLGFLYEIERVDDIPFAFDFSMNMLPGMQMAVGRAHGTRNRRTRASSVDGDDYVLIVNQRGPHLIEQRGREIVLGDGDAVLVSSSDPSAFTHRPPGEMLVLRFPKTNLTARVKGVDDLTMQVIPRDRPALGFLRNYVGLAWDERMTATAEMQHLMLSHIYDLTGTVMGGVTRDAAERVHGGVRAARLHTIKQDIANLLHRSDLSVTDIAARHGCTPRYVQRLFEAEATTYTDYVLSQRIARAHRMLSDPRYAHEKISAVAYDCGFGDLSYFNRAFRRQCGVAPSDVRALGLPQ
jgi:AraC-like DNA-binding protein